MNSQLVIEKDRIIIVQEKAGNVYLIPFSIALISFLVPFLAIVFAFNLREFESSNIPGLLISIGIFWSVGFYTGRQYLWGRFGSPPENPEPTLFH